MELRTILIAIPIFILIYQAIGIFLESRSDKQWVQVNPETKEEFGSRTAREITHFSNKFTFNKIFLKNERLNEYLELLLLRSGHPFGWKAENFLFIKEVFAGLTVLLLWYFGARDMTTFAMGGVLGFLIPDFYIKGKISERQANIQRLLPGFVDLMALTLEGGLDFLAAVERILDKMKPTFLKEEFNVLLQETRLGTPRKEAMKNIAFRVNIPDMQSLASMVIQSEELGTSLANILRNYAEDMRSKRILRAEEAAGKTPVKLLFPMMIFFFPIVFVIIFGPIAYNYMTGQ